MNSRIPSALVLGALCIAHPTAGQMLNGQSLVQALQHGGYVLVIRHASSPHELPDATTADRENVNRERQLDQGGRAAATAMGEALRRLGVPIGHVFTSPTYRARQTVELARLPNAHAEPALGDGGQSMQGITAAQTAWLRARAATFRPGNNAVLVTHLPNITAAFPQWSAGLSDGEALVLGPDAQGNPALIGRIKIEEWPRLKR